MKTKINLSLVICYNNQEQLDNLFLKSYNTQDVECELLLIDNRNFQFNSAAAALNHGANLSTMDYLLFVHQDISFLASDSLKNIFFYMEKNKNAIIGAAGVIKGQLGIQTSILEGYDMHTLGANPLSAEIAVYTLDECMFGMHKSLFHGFDEKTCDNWHFYAVDTCLTANLQNIPVLVIPTTICHFSRGTISHSFFNGLRKLKRKYSGKLDKIETCCVGTSTKRFSYKGIILLKEIRYKLTGKA